VHHSYTSTLLKLLLCGCTLLLSGVAALAQEEAQIIQNGKRYLDLNIHTLNRYSQRAIHQQKLLLRKLKKKEERFARQLKQKDSAAYARYKSQSLSYDSISHMLHPDSATLVAKTKRGANKVIDSLKGVQAFIQANAAKAGIGAPELGKYTGELGSLQQKLDYNEYINELINQHTNGLKGLSPKANIPALSGIEQQLFYGKSKIAAWKQVAEEPSKLEEKALEYLQGTKGFDGALSKATADPNSMQAGMSSDDLERMGFQTKTSVNKALQQKLGSNIGQVQQQMGTQLSEWQDKTQGALAEVRQAKQEIKLTTQQVKNIQKPSFKINPMRGKPFRLRLERQYDFQAVRATNEKPALLNLSASIGYKHTPSFSYGIGAIGHLGLGKNWSNVHFSFEGIGVRAYSRIQWRYGIGGYAAYERTWKENVFTGGDNDPPELTPSVHNTATYSDALVAGIEKQYKISTKYSGAIQLLVDVYWKEKGLRSPFVIRFATLGK